MKPCPFCETIANDSSNRIVEENEHAIAIRDGYPISPGHTLIIPRRHQKSFFSLSADEQKAILALVNSQHSELQDEFELVDCNIGINDGPLAGQTIPHCHIHIIPRVMGDVDDPRGGLRWVVPDKADYWSK